MNYQILVNSEKYGPFTNVQVLEDRYRVEANGGEGDLPFTVIGGQGVVGLWEGELPAPPPPVPPSAAEFEAALDRYFNAVAESDRWDSRFTLMVRAGYPNKWQQKAIAFGIWVDECNVFAIELLERVMAGEAPVPESIEAFIALLPPPPDMTSDQLKGAH